MHGALATLSSRPAKEAGVRHSEGDMSARADAAAGGKNAEDSSISIESSSIKNVCEATRGLGRGCASTQQTS